MGRERDGMEREQAASVMNRCKQITSKNYSFQALSGPLMTTRFLGPNIVWFTGGAIAAPCG